MEIKTKTIYVAFDGEEFNTEDSCKNYERRFEIQTKIKMYGIDFNKLDADEDGDSKWYECTYIYIPDDVDIEELGDIVGREYGWSIPPNSGWWEYNWQTTEWESFSVTLDKAKKMEKLMAGEL